MTGTRLLVVEDDGLIRLDLVDTLSDLGFSVDDASDADEALKVLEAENGYSAILTDIDMPGSINGVGLAKVVQARWPETKIIVISGRYTPMEGVLPSGARFLVKPVSEKLVSSTLKELGVDA